MNNHQHSSPLGMARVQFIGQYEPIRGINYHFVLPSLERIEGQTDNDGYTKTLITDSLRVHTGTINDVGVICYIKPDNKITPIIIEVQRDDGTWKEIGHFTLDTEKEKNITAQIETILLPFKLERMEGL